MGKVKAGASRPLAELRQSAGLSRNKAAVLLDIGLTTLGRYESGENDVPFGVGERMAVIYNAAFEDVRLAIQNTKGLEMYNSGDTSTSKRKRLAPQMVVRLSPELGKRIRDWSNDTKMPPEQLAIELLEEYFDDCDDADRLEALIQSGEMKTYPAEEVHKELASLAAVEG